MNLSPTEETIIWTYRNAYSCIHFGCTWAWIVGTIAYDYLFTCPNNSEAHSIPPRLVLYGEDVTRHIAAACLYHKATQTTTDITAELESYVPQDGDETVLMSDICNPDIYGNDIELHIVLLDGQQFILNLDDEMVIRID